MSENTQNTPKQSSPKPAPKKQSLWEKTGEVAQLIYEQKKKWYFAIFELLFWMSLIA